MAYYKGYTITRTANVYTNGKRNYEVNDKELCPYSFITIKNAKDYIDKNQLPHKGTTDYFHAKLTDYQTKVEEYKTMATKAMKEFFLSILTTPNKPLFLFGTTNEDNTSNFYVIPYCNEEGEYVNFDLRGIEKNENDKLLLIGYLDDGFGSYCMDELDEEELEHIPLDYFIDVNNILDSLVAQYDEGD